MEVKSEIIGILNIYLLKAFWS